MMACVDGVRPRLRPPLNVRDRETLGWVVMTTGGNDIIHNYGRTPPTECAMFGASLEQARPWITDFEHRLGRMLAELRKRFPGGCRVFLANIYDPTDGVGVAKIAGLPYWDDGLKIHSEYNAVMKSVSSGVTDFPSTWTRGRCGSSASTVTDSGVTRSQVRSTSFATSA